MNEDINKSEIFTSKSDRYIYSKNGSSIFIRSMFEIKCKDWGDNYINTYILDDNIYLVFTKKDIEFSNSLIFDILERLETYINRYENDDWVIYKMLVPIKYIIDYKYILIGKYSKTTEEYKSAVLNKSRLFEKHNDNKPRDLLDYIRKTLYPTKKDLEYIKKDLDVDFDIEEYCSVLDENLNIFKPNKFNFNNEEFD